MCIFQHSFVAAPNWLKKKATIHLEFSSMVCIQNMRNKSFVLSHVCDNKLSLEFVKVLKISLRPLPHPHPTPKLYICPIVFVELGDGGRFFQVGGGGGAD